MWEIKEVPWSLSFWISILLVLGSIIIDEIDSHGLRHYIRFVSRQDLSLSLNRVN
jgi:hypothetical protein